MNTLRYASTILVAVALSVSACASPATKPDSGATAKATATVKPPVAEQVNVSQPKYADKAVVNDLTIVSKVQNIYIKAHPTKHGVAVTAGKPGEPVKITNTLIYPALPGDVIAVKVSATGYCIAVYNKYASKASTATKAMLYKSDAGGIQKVLGTC